jgi:hypothetical protein
MPYCWSVLYNSSDIVIVVCTVGFATHFVFVFLSIFTKCLSPLLACHQQQAHKSFIFMWAIIYLCTMGTDFASFCDFSFGCWNCSDSQLFFVFNFNLELYYIFNTGICLHMNREMHCSIVFWNNMVVDTLPACSSTNSLGGHLFNMGVKGVVTHARDIPRGFG